MVKNGRFLLDTHVFLWWVSNDKHLSAQTKDILTDPVNQVFFSVASAWEIVIKKKLGKLRIPSDLDQAIVYSGFTVLPITLEHVLLVEKLPPYHHDPFDRMLIAQANIEELILITSDRQLDRYKEEVMLRRL